jgi:hypothetical protein
LSKTLLVLAFASLVSAAPLPAAAQAQATVGKCNAIETRQVKLDGKNDEWVAADLKVKPEDFVLVFAKGEVVVGKHLGGVNANGSRGDGYGKVEMKIGTGTVIATGTKFVGGIEEGGTVKFRVWDTDHRDNAGGFDVFVIVIPSSVIPDPTIVAAE